LPAAAASADGASAGQNARPCSLVDPVPQVLNVVGGLGLRVGQVRLGHAVGDLMNIHDQRHVWPLFRSPELSQRP
jgi:hypothetical protein